MGAIAIITARGGSKRIQHKNIKEFCGKPILQYSIEAAIESAIFDEIMVYTDDKRISDLSIKFGAKVLFMSSPETSDEFRMISDVIDEVLAVYGKIGVHFEYGCCLCSTAPFITTEKLKFGMDKLMKEEASTVISVVAYSFPPQRGLVLRSGQGVWLCPENLNVRSQDLEQIYYDCGQFYCFNVSEFIKNKTLFNSSTSPMVMDEMEVQGIDDLNDWDIAELKYQLMINNRKK